MSSLYTSYECPGCGESFMSKDFDGDGLTETVVCEDCGCRFQLNIAVEFNVQTTELK